MTELKPETALRGTTPVRRIVSNTAILFSAQAVSKILGAVVTIVAARELGVEDYGLYVFATTFGYVFAVAVAFGLPRLITREVARDPRETPAALGRALTVETLFAATAILGMLAASLLLGYPAHRTMVVTVAGSSMVFAAVLDVIVAFFRAHQQMDLEAALRLSLSVLILILSLLVILAGYGVLALAAVQTAAFLAILVFGVLLAVRKYGRPSFTKDGRVYRRLLLTALPFALSTFFIFIYDGTTPLFLSFISGDVATGLYSGATNFVRIFTILPASLAAAFLPAMSQLGKERGAVAPSPGRPVAASDELASAKDTGLHSSPPGRGVGWDALFWRSIKYLLIMALPLAVGLTVVSDYVVPLVLGNEYGASVGILRMAAWVLIPVFLNHGLATALISLDREREFLKAVGLAVIVNVVANLVLIPKWGAYGAVAASLLTEGLMLCAQAYLLQKAGARVSILALSARPLLSASLMALGVYLVHPLGLAAMVAVGAAIYLVALLLLRTFDSDEIELVRSYGWAIAARLPGRLRLGRHLPQRDGSLPE